MLSLIYPCGLQGAQATFFCMHCYARLNQSNVAGVAHLADAPNDPRPRHLADPPRRGGSHAVAMRATRFASAGQQFRMGHLPKKPDPRDFQSCVAQPLLWCREQVETVACTPLHYMLGLGLDGIKGLEQQCKLYDYEFARGEGKAPDDEELAAKVDKAQHKLAGLERQNDENDFDISNELYALEIIEATPNSEEAVVRGKGKASRKVKYKAVPLEIEYREHRLKLETLQKRSGELQKKIDAARDEIVTLWSGDRGPFQTTFDDVVDQLQMSFKAYFGGALVGKDVHKVYEPDNIKKFTDILRPRRACKLNVASEVDGNGHASVHVKLNMFTAGDDEKANKYLKLFSAFGRCASLMTRVEALCDHERKDFRKHAADWARAFADLYPEKQVTQKGHGMVTHVPEQLDYWGNLGQKSEGVVESLHVKDNEFVRRCACIRDKELNAATRAKIHLRTTYPTFENIRDRDNFNQHTKRLKLNQQSREKRLRHELGPC